MGFAAGEFTRGRLAQQTSVVDRLQEKKSLAVLSNLHWMVARSPEGPGCSSVDPIKLVMLAAGRL